MSVKEYFKSTLLTFFIVVTLVNFAMFTLGTIFEPNQRFGYEAFLYPLLFGVFSMIPTWIMYSKRELTIKQMIIRKILQLIVLEMILLFVGFGKDLLTMKELPMKAAFAASVLVVFVFAHLFQWWIDSRDAKTMTQELEEFKLRNS